MYSLQSNECFRQINRYIFKLHIRCLDQCNQMGKLDFNLLQIYNTENLPKSIKNCENRLKISPNVITPSKIAKDN